MGVPLFSPHHLPGEIVFRFAAWLNPVPGLQQGGFRPPQNGKKVPKNRLRPSPKIIRVTPYPWPSELLRNENSSDLAESFIVVPLGVGIAVLQAVPGSVRITITSDTGCNRAVPLRIVTGCGFSYLCASLTSG